MLYINQDAEEISKAEYNFLKKLRTGLEYSQTYKSFHTLNPKSHLKWFDFNFNTDKLNFLSDSGYITQSIGLLTGEKYRITNLGKKLIKQYEKIN